MAETQESMALWAEQIFGPVSEPLSLVGRASVELEELAEAVLDRDREEIGREAADVVILLSRLMHEFDLTLDEEVNKKMAINRARKWVPAGDGTGAHIKEQ